MLNDDDDYHGDSGGDRDDVDVVLFKEMEVNVKYFLNVQNRKNASNKMNTVDYWFGTQYLQSLEVFILIFTKRKS